MLTDKRTDTGETNLGRGKVSAKRNVLHFVLSSISLLRMIKSRFDVSTTFSLLMLLASST